MTKNRIMDSDFETEEMEIMKMLGMNSLRHICKKVHIPSRSRTMLSLLLLHILSLLVVPAAAATFPQFTEGNTGASLQTLAIDAQTNAIFVGSMNRVYKLRSNLTLEKEVVTGPKKDCTPPRAVCPDSELVDNFNKVLLVDGDQLIVCGTVFQGVCDILSVSSLDVLSNSSQIEISVNTEYGTTVAYVGNGPQDQKSLYVGSSLSEWVRADWTISSRELPADLSDPNLFKEYGGVAYPSLIRIPTGLGSASQPFNISYVAGFAANGFSYFVALQPKSFVNPSQYYTKITQVCQDDDHFYSYIELPLQCYGYTAEGRSLYNVAQSAYVGTVGSNLGSADLQPGTEVLYVVFTQAVENTLTPEAKSAVCMYPLSVVDNAFWKRRLGCALKETDNTEIDWLGSNSCGTSQGMINLINTTGPSYCHKVNQNYPLGGDFPIVASAVYTHSSVVTSIAATVHLQETIVFLGDQDGQMKKLRLVDDSTAQLYEEMTIDSDGGMVKNGMKLSPDQDHVYVLTDTKITKVPVEECEGYTTFEECVGVGGGVGDPYCGWCTLYQRCTRGIESECPGGNNSSNFRWLSGSDQNTEILDITPPNTGSQEVTMIQLSVRNLPTIDIGEAYQCVFGDLGIKPASVDYPQGNPATVTCYTPSNIPAPTNGFTRVDLSLRPTQTDVDVVSSTFDFYKCDTFTDCGECVAQTFGCNWCGYENLCTHSSSWCQAEGVILGTGTATSSPSDAVGPDSCPRVDLGDDVDEILIVAGVQREVSLNVSNLPQPLEGQANGYECVFRYEGRDRRLSARLEGEEELVCDGYPYDYEEETSSISGTLKVEWNTHTITETDIPVVLYKCEVDRPNCGLCLSADPKFGCGWCSSTVGCMVQDQCPDMGVTEWLMGSDQVCPDPRITEFLPVSGHVAGGTQLTIKGSNLGLVASDIASISVAGKECVINETSYITALQITCTTEDSGTPMSGPVLVQIGYSGNQMYTATSEQVFSYVLPKITGVNPAFGPTSGGSLVSILGVNLNAGSSLHASLSGVLCAIVSTAPSEVVCTSGPSDSNQIGYVSMSVDDHYIEALSEFEYRSDPVITKASRFTSINSGSLELLFDGEDFDSIQWPRLSFNIKGAILETNCSVTPTRLTCLTPDVRTLNLTLPYSVPIESINLMLDGVMEYAPLQNNGRISGLANTFVFYSDPVYNSFENGRMELEHTQRKFVTITGDNLTLAYKEGDVSVTVGGEECTDVVVKQTQLTCYAPERAPDSSSGVTIYQVNVHHGSLMFSVGTVEYLPPGVPLALIVGCAAGGVLLLLFILIMAVCVASYRKNHNNERMFKELEGQRDALELTVAQECKEAFAELQTGVLSFTHDIKGHGIPILDYRSYVVKSLFPDTPNHAVLRELSVAGVRKDYVQKGLWQFCHLLSNKSFLLIFIRVLEEQRTLSTKDLSNVASLLVVAFQGKMEYCTDVLKALMARAIRQHVKEGEESTRIFMRKGVSVVEKMVGHWLTSLLYTYLQNVASEPLFKLFYAIKQQVEKGPVDSVTGEARYSLTEGKLIRQQIEVKNLTLKAQGPDRSTQMVEVRVLDCDTISQTKDKVLDALYKLSPFSQRPHRDELDLEWYDRPGGKLLLFDDDGLRPSEAGWRKLNTLATYQIPDGATVFLLQTQGSSGSLHSNHSSPARMYNNVNVTFHQTPSSSMSPMITMDFDKDRVWHLVKPADHQPYQNGVNERKMMAEIYLPRLLTTKTILHKFVDDLVTTIFFMDPHEGSSLPLAIKYLFDFLDEQAEDNGVTDPEIIHAWKSNCLPLRFWVNLVKNPDMLFDIHKADTVDSCLSVVAQCIMEACSVSEQQLNKNSPASKLLYAKDIPQYKEYVSQYYSDIQSMPVISDQDMNAMLAEHSQRHHYDFYTLSALNELYFNYACKYRSELMSALDEDVTAIKQGHAEKIEEIERIMSKSF